MRMGKCQSFPRNLPEKPLQSKELKTKIIHGLESPLMQ